MITSTLTSKAQTTVPRSVRQALSLAPGDRIAYEIAGDAVVIRRARAEAALADADAFALFSEWDSEEDRRDWGD